MEGINKTWVGSNSPPSPTKKNKSAWNSVVQQAVVHTKGCTKLLAFTQWITLILSSQTWLCLNFTLKLIALQELNYLFFSPLADSMPTLLCLCFFKMILFSIRNYLKLFFWAFHPGNSWQSLFPMDFTQTIVKIVYLDYTVHYCVKLYSIVLIVSYD